MTPQERKLIDELFDRLESLENTPRDPDAVAAINQGLERAPNALYPLVQTALVQDEALKRAETGGETLGLAVERVILETQFQEIEGEILENPGAFEPWLIRRRRDD